MSNRNTRTPAEALALLAAEEIKHLDITHADDIRSAANYSGPYDDAMSEAAYQDHLEELASGTCPVESAQRQYDQNKGN